MDFDIKDPFKDFKNSILVCPKRLVEMVKFADSYVHNEKSFYPNILGFTVISNIFIDPNRGYIVDSQGKITILVFDEDNA